MWERPGLEDVAPGYYLFILGGAGAGPVGKALGSN